MKKIVFVILSIFAFVAYADNTITSKEYVDGQVSNLQTQIPAKNTNTVLTNTGTAGTVGEKAIYDASAAYGAQSDALVTAGAFNSAIQNALESEFVCVEWQGSVHDNAHCLLYEVRGATQMHPLPTGYTHLEYLESSGIQWIDTGVVPDDTFGLRVKGQILVNNAWDNVIVGVREQNSRFWIDIDFSINNNLGSVLIGWNSYRPAVNAPQLKVMGTNMFTIESNYKNSRVATVNGEIYNVGTLDTLLRPRSSSIYVFASHSDSDGVIYRTAARVWELKISQETDIVHNYVPARRDSDGELGLYDTVTNTFFTNAGTGEFIAGPVASYLPQGN
ncbi:MAG: hypothetical protein J5611_01245 [Alphaproteobacteria bacterium]|nr:hypothetical protein [Alphaproteobacteria bacterium]